MVPEKIYVGFEWNKECEMWKFNSCHKTLQGVLDEVAWMNLDWWGYGHPVFEPWPYNTQWDGKNGKYIFKIEVKDLLH